MGFTDNYWLPSTRTLANAVHPHGVSVLVAVWQERVSALDLSQNNQITPLLLSSCSSRQNPYGGLDQPRHTVSGRHSGQYIQSAAVARLRHSIAHRSLPLYSIECARRQGIQKSTCLAQWPSSSAVLAGTI